MRFKRCRMQNCTINEFKMKKQLKVAKRNLQTNSFSNSKSSTSGINNHRQQKYDNRNEVIKMCRLATALALLSLSISATLASQPAAENGFNSASSNISQYLSKLFVAGRTVLHPIPAPSLNSTSSAGGQVQAGSSSTKPPTVAAAAPKAQTNGTRMGSSVGSNSTKGVGEGFGEQTSDSLFRPSFFKGLLGGGSSSQDKPSDEQPEEEEEEVTQTIEVPMTQAVSGSDAGGLTAAGSKHSTKAAKAAAKLHLNQANLLRSFKRKRHQQQQQQQMMLAAGQRPGFHPSEIQPKPEASFRLSHSEMNNILNDREAPEFYKERETVGDGVMVGEEQPRLGTAASDRMHGPGPGMMGGYMGGFGGGGFSGGSYADQRLHQAGSGDPSMGGFNHRFGHQGFGRGGDMGDDDEVNSAERGRLMQSPNEFNEMSSHAAGYGHSGSYGPMDYSPQSGYLRAGSGDYNEHHEGGFGHSGMSGGYPSSPMLDRHASEMYGPGSGGFGGSSGFGRGFGSDGFGMQGAGYGGRLHQAGSHIGDAGFGSGMHSSGFGSDDYSSRFGHSGFANSNNMMMRGNSMRSNSMDDSVGRLRQSGSRNGPKLMPLTPVVPVAEELGPNGFPDPMLHERDSMRSGSRARQHKSKQQPEVYEALDEDIGPGDTSESEENSTQVEGNANDDPDDGPSTDESIATTMATDGGSQPSSGKGSSQRSTKSGLGNGRSVPSFSAATPGSEQDNSFTAANAFRPHVEFNRVGSAGYLPPNMPDSSDRFNGRAGSARPQRQRLLKKTSGFLVHSNVQQQQQQAHRSSARDGSDYDPAENPAHAGKYIID